MIKKKIDDKLINLIVKDLQPISIVEDCGFGELITHLDPRYKIPSRKTVSKMINEKYEKVKSELIRDLEV